MVAPVSLRGTLLVLINSIPPPVGALLHYPESGSSIPRGYALTLGQAHFIADYPDLYALIGNSFGAIGPGTFLFPKLTDRYGTPLLIYTGGTSTPPLSIGAENARTNFLKFSNRLDISQRTKALRTAPSSISRLAKSGFR